jgi:spore germination cell wall hydrolase CwlJ-like protein
MSWWECLQIAFDVLNGVVGNPAPGADSYYSDTMATPPSWADPQKLVVKIGHHLFYDLDSDHEKGVMS